MFRRNAILLAASLAAAAISPRALADVQYTWTVVSNSPFNQVVTASFTISDAAYIAGTFTASDVVGMTFDNTISAVLTNADGITNCIGLLSPDRSEILGGSLTKFLGTNTAGNPVTFQYTFGPSDTDTFTISNQPYLTHTGIGGFHGPAFSTQTIATNFGPGETYRPGGGWIVGNNAGTRLSVATPFTAPSLPQQFALDAVTLPLWIINSGSTVTVPVQIAIDDNGRPGAVIETINLFVLGTHAAVGYSTLHPTLQPGATYWIVAPGSPIEQQLTWSANSIGIQGGFLIRTNDQPWSPGDSDRNQPAFRISGVPISGACCTASAACTLTTPSACGTLGGNYRGNGVACQPLPCIITLPQGACCRGGGCTITSSFECAFSSGQFIGLGSVCSPATLYGGINPCCRADINNSGTLSVQDLFDYLSAYFCGCP